MYNNQYLQSRLEITSSDTMVSTTNAKYRFRIYNTNDVPNRSSIYITFPSTYTLSCSGTWTITNLAPNNACPSSGIVCKSVEQRLELLNCFTTQYVTSPGPIDFEIEGFTNPATTETQYLGVTTYQYIPGGVYAIDSSSSYFGVTATTGVLTITSITP